MEKEFLFFSLIFMISVISSCTEEGLGGTSSISGQVKHHSDSVPAALVLIKYDANELPGTQVGDYDDQAMASSDNGQYEFTGLQRGSYYLYSMGYDSLIFDSVFGGIHIRIGNGEQAKTNIPVTE